VVVLLPEAVMRALLMSIQNLIPFTPYAYGGEKTACNLCGAHGVVTVCGHDRRLKRLTTIACEECGLIRTDPMPTDEELAAYYASEYRRDYQWAFSDKPPRFHLKRSTREAKARAAILAPVLKDGSRILDFGSGSGEFLNEMRQAGHRVLGIEPGESFARHARETYGVKVLSQPWQEVELPAGGFDVITAHHVLEHLREPVTAMSRLRDWLADDGVIYIAVPNGEATRDQTFQHFHFAHVHTFTQQTLIWAGRAVGLMVDRRVTPEGTMVVFRKNPAGPETQSWQPAQGALVAARFAAASPLRFLLSGQWLVDALRRARKTVRDSRA
jgi:2-polyprenyl-3-methyl-5-hydroxy-6-metoxy-1,4-benzoquinol methylase